VFDHILLAAPFYLHSRRYQSASTLADAICIKHFYIKLQLAHLYTMKLIGAKIAKVAPK
jgi:hypothetical protein